MASGVASSLPVHLTSFVGRQRELNQLREFLRDVRLLTLVGAGGIGKTRLAVQLIRDLDPALLPDGVCFVDLTPLHDPALVPQTVASALNLREQLGQPVHVSICEALKASCMVLILDNCEHLVDACAELVESVLRTCPELRIIATSRQPLRVEGETTWRVPALQLPELRAESRSDDLATSEAVRLFVERAHSALPSFALTDRNAGSVTEICRRLDGIPLAIELAAARISVLGLQQILDRLHDRFKLLTASNRADPRHRTLRATVEWSHELLSPLQQILFRRLAVFAGGWTLEAAESICADEHIRAENILDVLAQLVNHSLVIADGQETVVRYTWLETLRDFAAERLTSASEGPYFHDRHLKWFLHLAEHADDELNGPHQSAWLEVLEREHDNIRAALRWSLASNSLELALRLASACCYFWQIRGHRYRSEARRWLEDTLTTTRAPEAPPKLRARALYWAGTFAGEQHDFSPATAYLEASLELWRAIGNTRGTIESQLGLAVVFRDTGRYQRAQELLEDSLLQARELDDRLKVARILRYIGSTAARLGEGEIALAALNESLELLASLGEDHLSGHVLDHIGEAELARGHTERAAEAERRGAALLATAGCMEGVNTTVYNRARIAQRRGEQADALALAVESLRACELGNQREVPACLDLIAECLSGPRPEVAAQLFGAADAVRATICLPVPNLHRKSYDEGLARARTALGGAVFDSARNKGRSLSRNDAIELAVRCAMGSTVQAATTTSAGPLSARELQVARLVGQGLSNKEIASVLVVSIRTAEAHVTNVLSKLGLRSRAQLAVWAAEHDLLN
ncbi:MAG: tetratricopeptide repeat protein [Chloroflexi bacterium]|nr:tetratricopeptide repeat protein [Chloroflexota bacterium]